MRTICIMMILLSCMSVYAQNVELLDPDEQETLNALEVLQWSEGLSTNQVAFVTNALYSSIDTVAEVALRVAIMHDVSGLKEMLQRGIGPSDGYSRLLSRAVIEGLEEGQSAIESLLGKHLLKQVPKDAHAEVKGKASHIIAFYVSRKLRRGEVPGFTWENLEFSSFDRKLLQYSKRPSVDVTREIIGQLGQASVAGSDEYDLVRVLDSYVDVSLDVMLEAFKAEGTEVYGKVLLLSCVEERVSRMTDEEKQKVKSALEEHETQDKRIERALKRLQKRLEKKQKKVE